MQGPPGDDKEAVKASSETAQAIEAVEREDEDIPAKILVVDDEEVVCKFLENLLT